MSPAARSAVQQLAVVPGGAEAELLRELFGDLASIAEAEEAGVLTLRLGKVAFRHELARRAVEGALPASVRLDLNARVLEVLLARDPADPFRILHHAVEAGDDHAVVHYGAVAGARGDAVGGPPPGGGLLRPGPGPWRAAPGPPAGRPG